MVIIDDLLGRLEREHTRRCRIFAMRFFAGLSVEELADILQVSENTVIRDYRMACAWLRFHFEPSRPLSFAGGRPVPGTPERLFQLCEGHRFGRRYEVDSDNCFLVRELYRPLPDPILVWKPESR